MRSRFAWLTDPHLGYLTRTQATHVGSDLKGFDGILLTGDIANGEDTRTRLRALKDGFGGPIYYVLGNHDCWDVGTKKARGAALAGKSGVYLSRGKTEDLGHDVTLAGQDGWYDLQYGRGESSSWLLSDVYRIPEMGVPAYLGVAPAAFSLGMKAVRAEAGREIGRAKKTLREVLPVPHLLFLTHVPPFVETCRHLDSVSNDDALPWFSSKGLGDALLDAERTHTGTRMTVLCGHTHTPAEYVSESGRLRVYAGNALEGSVFLSGVVSVGPEGVLVEPSSQRLA